MQKSTKICDTRPRLHAQQYAQSWVEIASGFFSNISAWLGLRLAFALNKAAVNLSDTLGRLTIGPTIDPMAES